MGMRYVMIVYEEYVELLGVEVELWALWTWIKPNLELEALFTQNLNGWV